MLIDVAGEDESASDQSMIDEGKLKNAGRDATALTVVEVDLSTLLDELIQAPTYRVTWRSSWAGVKHTSLYAQIKSLADLWGVRYMVIDSTGVGAGLASFLDKAITEQGPFPSSSLRRRRASWAGIS